jgi:ABC-2 type transport system ATP-binding protein
MGAIEVTNLRKVYADETVALDDVSLQVSMGEIFGYLGRNGAGKTTTVRILTTLARKTSGTVLVLGTDVDSGREFVRRHIGVSLQQAALDELMTGREHLLMIATLGKLSNAQARVRAAELIAGFELGHVADRLVATYSVGMRRRLDTALAIARHPKILFLDEPTTGLDPQSRRTVWSLIRRYKAEGGTVFLTTQHLGEADELCDQIAILGGGRIVAAESPEFLKRHLGGKIVRVARADEQMRWRITDVFGGDAVSAVGTRLDVDISRVSESLPATLMRLLGIGLTEDQISIADPTLEDVFVRLTGPAADSADIEGSGGGIAALGRSIAATGRRGP